MASDRRIWFTHKCRYCNYLFVCEKDLVYHEASHDEANFVCDVCLMVFDDADQLSTHVNDGCLPAETALAIGRRHVCQTCGDIFRYVHELYRHYRRQHMADKSTSTDGHEQSAAAAVTGSGSLVCATCAAVFSGAASLKVHLWKAHSISQHDAHILTRGNVAATCTHRQSASPCKRVSSADDSKPFKCSMCNWSFKYDFSFKSHLQMHERKQRCLEEMLRANRADSLSTVAGAAAAAHVQTGNAPNPSHLTVTSSLPIYTDHTDTGLHHADHANAMSSPSCAQLPTCKAVALKRKSSSHDDDDDDERGLSGAKSGVMCERRDCCNAVTDTQTHCSASTCTVTGCPSQGASSNDCSWSDEPFPFECRLCSFKCRYDFSYIAHLSQHDKLRELEIDDIQSHLIAGSGPAQTPTTAGPNPVALRLLTSQGQNQIVNSEGISYILFCPANVAETAIVATEFSDCNISTQTVPTEDCLSSRDVIDDVSSRPECDVDFSDGPDMQFLDANSGEMLYVVNESELDTSLPAAAAGEEGGGVKGERMSDEVVLTDADEQLLAVDVDADVTAACTAHDALSAQDDSMTLTCYYCSALFTDKACLERHILQLHIDS